MLFTQKFQQAPSVWEHRVPTWKERNGDRSSSMNVFLITILLAMVVGGRRTIISLRLFAHGAERVSRPRGERRVYIAPKSLDRDERISIYFRCLLEEARPF
jgi:hypothetical protein